MCWFRCGPAGIALSQGKGSSGLMILSGGRSLVSMRYIIAVMSAGSFVIVMYRGLGWRRGWGVSCPSFVSFGIARF